MSDSVAPGSTGPDAGRPDGPEGDPVAAVVAAEATGAPLAGGAPGELDLPPVDKDATPESKWFRDRNPNVRSDGTGWGDGEATPLAITRPSRPRAHYGRLTARLARRLVVLAVVLAPLGYGAAWANDAWTAQKGWVDQVMPSANLKFRFPERATMSKLGQSDVARVAGPGWEVTLQEIAPETGRPLDLVFGGKVTLDDMAKGATLMLGRSPDDVETLRHRLGEAVHFVGEIDGPDGRKRVETLLAAGDNRVIILRSTVDVDREDLGRFLYREIEKTLVET